MNRYLYIAEKPSTMREVKKVYLSAGKPLGEIDFMALHGHVCQLLEPKEYECWSGKWDTLPLPMVPEPFKVKAISKEVVKEVRDKLQANSYNAIIVGTDSDVEGNGIYDLLSQTLHLENYPTLRFFEKDLTEKGILESLQSLTDFHKNPRDIGMTQAYRIRSRFDWLVGYNLSVAYTVRSGFLMRVGRVKAPTLKLVYDNCKAIDEFQTKTAYLPMIQTAAPELFASLIENGKDWVFQTQEEGRALLEKTGTQAVVKAIEKKIVSRPPAQLYKLSDIQVEAGQKYGYSPEEVLNALQSLYEKHKVMSYPRTDGRYVSAEKVKDFPLLLKAVAALPGLKETADAIDGECISRISRSKRYVNDDEVAKSSHDALLPTGKIPDLSAMSEAEKNICTMVYKRFLAIFLPDLKEEKTKCLLETKAGMFVCRGSRVADRGFTVIFDRAPKEVLLPDIKEGQVLDIKNKGLHDVVSKPPKRLTQALLIEAMENIQKYMPKGELKDIMKEVKGIGQPSSRAAIIKELLQTGYMEEKKKALFITEKGKKYIENLQGCSIINPELSAVWEQHMQKIREGSEDFERVYHMILDYLNDVLKEMDGMTFAAPEKTEEQIDVKCPVCGKNLRKHKWGYGCSGYPQCKFTMGKICGKTLTERQVKDLYEKGKTNLIKGFTSKSGKKFNAYVLWDGKKVSFEFEKNSQRN